MLPRLASLDCRVGLACACACSAQAVGGVSVADARGALAPSVLGRGAQVPRKEARSLAACDDLVWVARSVAHDGHALVMHKPLYGADRH